MNDATLIGIILTAAGVTAGVVTALVHLGRFIYDMGRDVGESNMRRHPDRDDER